MSSGRIGSFDKKRGNGTTTRTGIETKNTRPGGYSFWRAYNCSDAVAWCFDSIIWGCVRFSCNILRIFTFSINTLKHTLFYCSRSNE